MNSTDNTNLIEAAVSHLKTEAIAKAEQFAKSIITMISAELAKSSLDECAPVPRAWQAPTATKEQYKAAQRKRDLYRRLSSADGQAKFVQEAREDAAFQYDAFVAKLNSKIGAVKSATLEGNHVWSYSFLTVITESGEKQTWKTTTILNQSCLGKVFNQFPTRKVKR